MNMTPEEERDALIDRYVNRKMTAEEEAEFEIRMMGDTELFEEMQVVDALKQGLSGHAGLAKESSEIDGTPPSKEETAFAANAPFQPFKLWLQQPLSLAASLLITTLGLHAIYTGLATETVADNKALAIGSVLLLENTRGDSSLQLSGPPPYLFQIDAGLGDKADAYSVTLRDAETNAVLLQQQNLYADDDGWVRLVLDQTLANEFYLEVDGIDINRTGQSRSYRIEIAE